MVMMMMLLLDEDDRRERNDDGVHEEIERAGYERDSRDRGSSIETLCRYYRCGRRQRQQW